ncbi:bomanin Bicipital 1 [Drosophila tropicalis]|uniref:bomanin Bicipital 1 n=1 Tax=Drosophila tropicalis TaxID=46794 RepID=UPI0035AC1EE2
MTNLSLSLAFVVLTALVAQSTAGKVIINGKCQNCSPPDAETLVVGDKVYKGTPGHGTVIIGGGSSGAAAGGSGSRAPSQDRVIEDGFSGRLPGGTYLHNKDCVGCSISGGGD